MSFAPSLMQGLLTANTALTSAQASSNTISRMQAQKETLKAEMASGNGDLEGKKAEIERIDTQTQKAAQMQQTALNEASSQLGTAIASKDDENTTEKAGSKTSQKAKDEAADLNDKLTDHEVAAVDYEKGMHIEADGKTSVAVSPEFLEKMADSDELSDVYAGHMETMKNLETSVASPAVVSQSWSVDRDGGIYHHAQVGAGTSAEEMESLRQSMHTAGAAAFGDTFKGVTLTSQLAPVPHIETGLLVDASL